MQAKVPATLIVGDKDKIQNTAQLILQRSFCQSSKDLDDAVLGECFCAQCRKIKNRQHPFLVWISPTKDYVVDDIQVIFDKIGFALDDGQSFYFVLDNAENLTSVTANKLLKVLEEPPIGYSFLLLTQNAHMILPTILSRCFVLHLGSSKHSDLIHPLLSFFIDEDKIYNFSEFESEIKKAAFTDTQSEELAWQLLSLLLGRQKRLHCNFLKEKLRRPPQSGSSEIFWKNLFLNWPR
jgi:DNA polymerase-3 subunit delta'